MKEDKRHTGGFAKLTPEQRSAIGRRGYERLLALGRVHRWTKETSAQANAKRRAARRGRRG